MTKVTAIGTEKKEIEVASTEFSIDTNLLSNADYTLAEAIIKSISESDPSMFSVTLFNSYHVDLSEGQQKTYLELFSAFKNADEEIERNFQEIMAMDDTKDEKELRESLKLESYNQAMLSFLDSQSWISSDYSSDEAFYFQATYEEENNVVEAIVNALESLSEQFDVDSNIHSTEFEDYLRTAMVEEMREKDTSTYQDLLPNDRVEFNFTKGFNWNGGCLDSAHIYINEVDERLGAFFEMANLKPQDFVAYAKENEEYDEEYLTQVLALKVKTDESRKPLLSAKDICEVLDNTAEYFIPMFTCFVEIKQLIEEDKTNGIFINGGVLGLEDCINGAGHNCDIDKSEKGIFISHEEFINNTTLYSGKGRYHTYDRQSVYGFYIPSVKGEITSVK